MIDALFHFDVGPKALNLSENVHLADFLTQSSLVHGGFDFLLY